MVTLKIFRAILLISLGILTGLEFCSTYCVHNAFYDLDNQTYIPIRQALDRTFTPVMANFLLFTGVLLFINLFTVKKKTSYEFLLFLLAFLFFESGFLITIFGNVPINISIDKMNPLSPPIYFTEIREKWNLLNTYRTWTSLLGYTFFCSAIFAKPSY
jgi:uncharacterized membrane protein